MEAVGRIMGFQLAIKNYERQSQKLITKSRKLITKSQKNKQMRKITILILLFFSAEFLIIVGCNNNSKSVSANVSKLTLQQNATQTKEVTDSLKKDTITIVSVGDMMLGTNYPRRPNYLPPKGDCSFLLRNVSEYLRDADLTFGNCEGTFSDKPEYARDCYGSRWCYRFSMPTKFVNCMVDAGFDVVSIANNHIRDLGEYGKKKTMETLKNAGIHFAGICEVPTDTFTIKGVKYGFCAFAPNVGTCQITNYTKMQETVKQLKKECQIVIVSFHGGAEGATHQHVTRKYEYFLKQNRGNVYKFAHSAIDAGADVVLGHGPHVTRAVELYKNRFIAYSLGNFATYKRFGINGVFGIAPILKLWIGDKGDFIKGKIIPVHQDLLKGTLYDEQGRVIKKIQELTKQDFPENILLISDDGTITSNK